MTTYYRLGFWCGLGLLSAACATPPTAGSFRIMPAALVPIDQVHDRSNEFGRVFCGTLTHFTDPNGHRWGDCTQYLNIVTSTAAPALPFVSPYRVLVVSGLGGDCLNDVQAFGPAIAHLRDAHQIDIEYYRVPPFGSSHDNGRTLAHHIDDGWTGDPAHRRYLLIGYSKGAADLLEAINLLEAPRTKIAALITVAGMVGGTSEYGTFRALMDPSQPWVDRSCLTDMGSALSSIRPDVRHEFLREHPPLVPSYSIVGVTSAQNTSKALQGSWTRLSGSAAEEDGLLVAWEGVLPGATFLGMARADHWAIALPFDQGPRRFKALDHNRFPRDALFEAIIRFVTADIPGTRPFQLGGSIHAAETGSPARTCSEGCARNLSKSDISRGDVMFLVDVGLRLGW